MDFIKSIESSGFFMQSIMITWRPSFSTVIGLLRTVSAILIVSIVSFTSCVRTICAPLYTAMAVHVRVPANRSDGLGLPKTPPIKDLRDTATKTGLPRTLNRSKLSNSARSHSCVFSGTHLPMPGSMTISVIPPFSAIQMLSTNAALVSENVRQSPGTFLVAISITGASKSDAVFTISWSFFSPLMSLMTLAPILRDFFAMLAYCVSIEMGTSTTSKTLFSAGNRRPTSSCTEIGFTPGAVDLAPMSSMSAPSSTIMDALSAT